MTREKSINHLLPSLYIPLFLIPFVLYACDHNWYSTFILLLVSSWKFSHIVTEAFFIFLFNTCMFLPAFSVSECTPHWLFLILAPINVLGISEKAMLTLPYFGDCSSTPLLDRCTLMSGKSLLEVLSRSLTPLTLSVMHKIDQEMALWVNFSLTSCTAGGFPREPRRIIPR